MSLKNISCTELIMNNILPAFKDPEKKYTVIAIPNISVDYYKYTFLKKLSKLLSMYNLKLKYIKNYETIVVYLDNIKYKDIKELVNISIIQNLNMIISTIHQTDLFNIYVKNSVEYVNTEVKNLLSKLPPNEEMSIIKIENIMNLGLIDRLTLTTAITYNIKHLLNYDSKWIFNTEYIVIANNNYNIDEILNKLYKDTL